MSAAKDVRHPPQQSAVALLLLLAFAAGMTGASAVSSRRGLLEDAKTGGKNATTTGGKNETTGKGATNATATTPPPPPAEKKEENIEKDLSLALAAIKAANITYNASTVATVFAPTDAAIRSWANKLNVSNTTNLLNATFLPFTINVTRLHIVPGAALSYANITKGKNYYVTSLLGPTLKIFKTGKGSVSVTVNGTSSSAEVTKADVRFNSTIVHVINKVLVPPFPST